MATHDFHTRIKALAEVRDAVLKDSSKTSAEKDAALAAFALAKHSGRVYFQGFLDGDTAANIESKIRNLGRDIVVVAGPSFKEATVRLHDEGLCDGLTDCVYNLGHDVE